MLLGVVWSGSTSAAEPVRLPPVVDLRGGIQSLEQNDRRVVRVFVFLSTECPISRSYLPELNRLAKEWAGGDSRVELFGVSSDATVARTTVAKQFEDEFKVAFPVLHDSASLLARVFQPTRVPEAFVLDADGRLVYRGAIDNAWEDIGRRRPRAEKTFLADAVRAVVAGQPVAVTQTKAAGCVFESRGETNGKDAAVTFTRDVAPIIFTRCMNCHRPGQVAPFSLTIHAEVAKHVPMIAEVTQRRIMPPWMPAGRRAAGASRDAESEHPRFVGERWLSDREMELLKLWSESGCAEGDPDHLPAMPEFAEGWRLGAPDLIVKMTEPFTVRADGPDLLQNFVIPIDIAEDKLVSAIEFHPGNKRVVHHAVLFLDDKQQARKLDQQTPEPGYALFGGVGFLPSGALGGWSVGNTARFLPNEMGRYLKRGSDLVVQVHYHPTGKVEVDQSEIGIYFVKKPVAESLKRPAKLVGSIWTANYEMDIPAGEKNYRRTTSYVLPKEVIMVGIVPHMHLLGKSMRVTATLPVAQAARVPESNGDAREPRAPQTTLIDIPAWNYNWQDEYYYERPFKLPAGTRITVEAAFDNSDENPSNPSSPPRRVTWGDGTLDEMLFCFFLLTAGKTEDLIHVIFDNLAHDAKQPRAKVEAKP
jgi:thiol-disulfide isomerase/thioredoxin